MKHFITQYSTELRDKTIQTSMDLLRAVHSRKQIFFAKKWEKQDWILIFALAMVVGMAGKTIAIKTVTIGYQDYTLKNQISTPLIKTDRLSQGPLCEE